MAVVSLYAPSAKDPAVATLAPPSKAEGRVRCIAAGPVTITNGNSALSKIYCGKLPSHAVPIPVMSQLAHAAITSVNDFDIGLEKDGAEVDWDLFADGLDISSAGTKNPLTTVAVANQGKAVWELLGLARDPGVEYDLVMTLKAAATATASVALFFSYGKK